MSGGRIFIAESCGFCSGVERAVRLVAEALKTGPYPVRVLHEIVHNETVVSDFTEQGAEFYEEPDAAWKGGTLILSAHGVGAALEAQVRAMPLKVVDATCPLVKLLHARASQLEEEGYSLILAASRSHRETQGVTGRLKKAPVILENTEETRRFLPEPGRKYALLSQTTIGMDDFSVIAEILRTKIPDLHVTGGICHATSSRQEAIRKLAKKCPRIVVIGSEKSSNSRRLRETAESAGAEAVLVPNVSGVPESFLKSSGNVGISAGASVPEFLIQETVQCFLKNGFLRG